VQPNTAALRPDFAAATTLPAAAGQTPKSVRFTDRPPSPPDPARAALFPYRDDPDDRSGLPDQSHLSNQGIHAYHATVLAEQDEQLDRLGESIGRQRDLSIQIGDELDEHVAMLDEVDGHVERHAGRLEVARKGIGRIVKRANDNRQLTVIAILIVLLVLLIVIFK
jgi:syntaxin 8